MEIVMNVIAFVLLVVMLPSVYQLQRAVRRADGERLPPNRLERWLKEITAEARLAEQQAERAKKERVRGQREADRAEAQRVSARACDDSDADVREFRAKAGIPLDETKRAAWKASRDGDKARRFREWEQRQDDNVAALNAAYRERDLARKPGQWEALDDDSVAALNEYHRKRVAADAWTDTREGIARRLNEETAFDLTSIPVRPVVLAGPVDAGDVQDAKPGE